MPKSYTQVTADINCGIAKIREGALEAMARFSALAKGAMKPGALSAEQKELIALAVAVYMGGGPSLKNIRLNNAFLLRTAVPPIASAQGRHVVGTRRMGKRIVISLDGDVHLVMHLMVAGRLKWLPTGAKPPGKSALAAFEFDTGTLVFTEAGTRRRASLHFVAGIAAVEALHAGGVEVSDLDLATFAGRLTTENHTLKRALTDPHIFSGIGNAYSDEILHRARLSPIAMTGKLRDDEAARLFDALRRTLSEWTERLRKEAGSSFPVPIVRYPDFRYSRVLEGVTL